MAPITPIMTKKQKLYILNICLFSIFAFLAYAIFSFIIYVNQKTQKTSMHVLTYQFTKYIQKNSASLPDGDIPVPRLEDSIIPYDDAYKDRWGTPFIIDLNKLSNGCHVKIRSAGKDKTFFTPDDIVVEQNSSFSQQE